ncbi:MAG: hypothetical protein HN948_01245 [Clostridia bacterium]|jgi:hypothetical protein|nr:hypothetical protein [Clostridia bacterium]MBT7121615.1 hypothetical protein [Clostridia bacterium]
MKKLILLVSALVLLLSGCTAISEKYFEILSSRIEDNEETQISNISEQNIEIIDSLMDLMQLDESEKSVAGFTSESTFGDVLDETDNGKISTVFQTYYSEFVGYPAVATYVFWNINDDTGRKDVGNPTLTLMTFDVFRDEYSTSDKQIEEIIESMDAILGEHSTNEYPGFYKWENEESYCSLNTDTDSFGLGAIARIQAFSKTEMDLSILFPYPFGTDIYTVYSNEKSFELLEWFTEDMYTYHFDDYSNHLIYDDGETSVCLFFDIEDSDLKLGGASLQTNLQSADIEEIDEGLEYFGDRMEDILGPADSRDITHYYNSLNLSMEWPGLGVRAHEWSDETYSIFIDFSEGYFTDNYDG